MQQDIDRLYKLLPAIYRQRDADRGMQLRALLQVIAEQVNLVEADIAQLYENWFIETCQDWVVPYIGDLVGYEVVHEAGEPGDVATSEGRQRNKILISRRDVANTIHDRRRKGTLSLLEQIALDVAGWPARAVEFYTLLGRQQNLSHVYSLRGRYADLRRGKALDRLSGPFDETEHTIDVRNMNSQFGAGRYNIPSVGLFVWRLKVYSVTNTRAFGAEEAGSQFFAFSILGNNTQLYTRAVAKAASQRRSNELNYPTPISRLDLEESLERSTHGRRPDDYYDPHRSLYIWTGHLQQTPAIPMLPEPQESARSRSQRKRGAQRQEQPQQQPQYAPPVSQVVWQPVEPQRIVVADLSNWTYRPRGSTVAVDPVLGRIAFSASHVPEGGVRVLYHYAFSADIGGGEYTRELSQPQKYQLFRVSKTGGIRSIQDALREWEKWKQRNANAGKPFNAIIEIMDSGVYTENRLRTSLAENETLQIRAANGKRPVIRLLDRRPDRTDALGAAGASNVIGASSSRFTLDGLLVEGRGIRISGDIAEVVIRHCTLVPGWEIDEECGTRWENEASLELVGTGAHVTIEHSILGSIQVAEDEDEGTSEDDEGDDDEPLHITISDSILDATSPRREALGAPEAAIANLTLTIARSTVFGKVRVHAIQLAENTIFNNHVQVARSQIGCMRFCYVPDGSRTPRRFNCQPDLVQREVDRQNADHPDQFPTDQDVAVEKQRESDRVQPAFNSVHYGTPDYCQLALVCAPEITQGADDESEMGVFHDLFQPQRAANLRARLNEYTPARSQAGIIYVN